MIRRILLTLGLIGASGLSGCSSFLFYPTNYLYDDPAKHGFEFEEIRIPSYDGTLLYGWYFHHTAHKKDPSSKPKAIIFYAHGNGGNISSQYQALYWTLDYGYDYYVFDYRGYGASGGSRPNPPEGVGDTIAALRWIDARARKEKIPLAAFGQSLGSALLVTAIGMERTRPESERTRVVTDPPRPDLFFIGLESTFLSYQWAAASVLSQHWITTPFQPFAFFLVIDDAAPKDYIKELSPTPTLFIHGDNDHLIDFRLGQQAYDAALPPKEFVRVPGGEHIGAFWGTEQAKFRTIFLDRLDAALKSRGSSK